MIRSEGYSLFGIGKIPTELFLIYEHNNNLTFGTYAKKTTDKFSINYAKFPHCLGK